MRSFLRAILVSALMFTVLPSGCRVPGGNGDGTPPVDLPAEQKAAVDSAAKQMEAAAVALAGVVDGFEGIDLTADGSFGECPVVTSVRDGGIVAVTLDYDDGCTNDYYGTAVISGSVTMNYNIATQTVTISYDGFSVDGHTISGAFILELNRAEDGGRILVGEIDISTATVGSAVGDASIQFNLLADTINVVTADLTLSEAGGDSYAVSVANLLMRPIGNGNFVPESGTITFEIPNTSPGPETITIVITYRGTTPDDGIVDVTVGPAEPVEYQLPGVGG